MRLSIALGIAAAALTVAAASAQSDHRVIIRNGGGDINIDANEDGWDHTRPKLRRPMSASLPISTPTTMANLTARSPPHGDSRWRLRERSRLQQERQPP